MEAPGRMDAAACALGTLKNTTHIPRDGISSDYRPWRTLT